MPKSSNSKRAKTISDLLIIKLTMSPITSRLVVTMCLVYGLISAVSTFTMKTVFADFSQFKSPALLLLGQSILNFSVGSVLVLVKTANQ